jgi:hypothetical protein
MHVTNNNKMDLTNLQNNNSNRVMIDPHKKKQLTHKFNLCYNLQHMNPMTLTS